MDALYARSNVFNKIVSHGKEALAVLKDQRRDLLTVAEDVFAKRNPDVTFKMGRTEYRCWDHMDSEAWNQVERCVRVVRSIESAASGCASRTPSTWTWVTTALPEVATIQTIVQIGHSRWSIENEGFNELANHWHADHVYKHGAVAMQNFWLMAMIACNLFRAFYARNLKPSVRAGKSMLHFARIITAEMYTSSTSGVPP